jgi:hypothetical protein
MYKAATNEMTEKEVFDTSKLRDLIKEYGKSA